MIQHLLFNTTVTVLDEIGQALGLAQSLNNYIQYFSHNGLKQEGSWELGVIPNDPLGVLLTTETGAVVVPNNSLHVNSTDWAAMQMNLLPTSISGTNNKVAGVYVGEGLPPVPEKLALIEGCSSNLHGCTHVYICATCTCSYSTCTHSVIIC